MITNVLSFGMPGGFEWLVIMMALFIVMLKWGLIIAGIIWLVKYLKRSSEERQRFRIELGKLTDEIQQIRQKLEGSQ